MGKHVRLIGTGDYTLEIVGERNYQDALLSICGGKCEEGHRRECVATLVHEDDNPYDRNAVRVDIDGLKVGYLSRDDAVTFRGKMKRRGFAGVDGVCKAIIRGGWDRGGGDVGHFGVILDIGY